MFSHNRTALELAPRVFPVAGDIEFKGSFVGNNSNPTLAYWPLASEIPPLASHRPTPSAQTLPPQHQFRLALRPALRPFTRSRPTTAHRVLRRDTPHPARTHTCLFLNQLKYTHTTERRQGFSHRFDVFRIRVAVLVDLGHTTTSAPIPPQHVVVDQPVSTAQPTPASPTALVDVGRT